MDFHSLCSPVHTNFLEAWICCALVLSNLTHSMNFYLEAITSMLSHWFWDQVITDWSILIHLWLPDLLHLLSCPIHSQSFCTHSWAALLSVLPCLHRFSSCLLLQVPIKIHPAPPVRKFLGILLDASLWISFTHLELQRLPGSEPEPWRQQAMIPVLCSLTTNPPVFHIPAGVRNFVVDL